MGHWEQIGVENRKERERRASRPRWRRELDRHVDAGAAVVGWGVLAAIGLRAFGLI